MLTHRRATIVAAVLSLSLVTAAPDPAAEVGPAAAAPGVRSDTPAAAETPTRTTPARTCVRAVASGRVAAGRAARMPRADAAAGAVGAPPDARGAPPDALPVPRDLGALTKRLREIVDAADNRAGVAVRDLSGRYGFRDIAVNGSFRPPAASVIKLWILAELLRQVDCGRLSLEKKVLVERRDVVAGAGDLRDEKLPQRVPVRRLAELMITVSDNTATNVLIDTLGGVAPVNALIRALGQQQTQLGSKLYDPSPRARGNYTSAVDVVSLLAAVWEGRLLSPASRDFMIDLMRGQTIDTKIPAALPPDAPVAHKTGELEDAAHDVGYYLIPGSEVAVAFLTAGPEAPGTELVRELARAVYDHVAPAPTDGLAEADAPD
ncbi:beta-lactamase class A [Micromonospora pattaloongensis]|uniref:Beta-lactamase class A n=1 Tax=Micromonospora pattaloongensis TaxID=405436 RepID=A0A1H3G8C9_9ACTN|nr:serine hydrolase [Micromonospora pattaloongensis]SDX99536.1 beta-lactamase class A [Micromonospora pattaloongensis]